MSQTGDIREDIDKFLNIVKTTNQLKEYRVKLIDYINQRCDIILKENNELNNFENILNEALNSVTCKEVLDNGEIIEDSGEYETYYSDCAGGEFTQVKIINYNGKYMYIKKKLLKTKSLIKNVNV